jgi:penicillin-binding protein 1A
MLRFGSLTGILLHMDGPRERLPVSVDPAPNKSVRNQKTVTQQRRRHPVLAFVRGLFGLIFAIGLVGAGAVGLVGWNLYERYSADLPTLDGLRTYQPPVMSRVYSGDDRLMTELANERRIFAPIAAIPDRVKQAFIAAEDKNFYSHHGVDPMAIARAAYTDLQRMGEARRPEGASTITQQVARNMLLESNTVSLERKVKEALLAIRIERTLTKQRILELYLNEIYLGQGAYGVVAAAQTYFNKPLDQLTLGESAMLAALPKSPSNYNPFHFPDAARNRRDWVLDRMVETRAITAEQAAQGKAEKLVPNRYRKPEALTGSAWFAEEVRRRLVERFGEDQTTQGGLIVHTSLDPALQGEADRALRAGLMRYDHSHGGWRGPAARIGSMASLAGDWADALGKVEKPPGMLPEWRLAVVLDETPGAARLGYLESDPADGAEPGPVPKTGEITLSELGWARPVLNNGDLGASPHRMDDVVKPGDIVMVQPEDGTLEMRLHEGRGRSRSEVLSLTHLTLRQIPKVEGALVSLDPVTGRVLAMSGGWDGDASKFNRATQAQRQPGSSFKPFVYLAAMEDGISPSARFDDEAFCLNGWCPNNYEMNFGGPTPLRIALEQSLNLVTVRVAQYVGMNAVAKTAIAFHLADSMPRVLPAALGAVETTVLREAGAYASLAEGGHEVVPSLISVQDRDGHVLWRPPSLVTGAGDPAQPPVLSDPRPAIADPQSAFQVVKMMEGVAKFGTGKPAVAGLDREIAGKTGTSQNYNDAWFSGFTPDLVTVVWVGFDAPQTLGDKQTGAEVAAPIWHDFMQQALHDRPLLDFRVPDGVSLQSWGCGTHMCVDAFKPDQVPGSAGVGPRAEDVVATDGNVQMVDPDPDAPATGGASATAAPGKPASGTGVDSGVGGLY